MAAASAAISERRTRSVKAAGAIPRGRDAAATLNVLAAVFAIVALVAVVSFGFVQKVTADPTADALASLAEREAELTNDLQQLSTAVDMFNATVADASDLSTRVDTALSALRGRVADAQVNEAEAARSALLSLIEAARPADVPVYVRPAIDPSSFQTVARAIDDVREVRDQVPSLISETRESRSQVVTAVEVLRTSLERLASQIKAEAPTTAIGQGVVPSRVRQAVLDAAASIPAITPSAGYGLAEMNAYSAAVDQLRSDYERAVTSGGGGASATTRSGSGRSPSNQGAPVPTQPVDPGPATPSQSPAPAPGDEESPAPAVTIEPPATG
jgi:vacuolar-type H+-ATPase subunit I/STV1